MKFIYDIKINIEWEGIEKVDLNDIEVLMYKILMYLYECMKSGEEAKIEKFSFDSKMMNVPKVYWIEVIAILCEKRLITGFKVNRNVLKDSKFYVQADPPYKITFEGVDFLHNNKSMKKVKEFLREMYNANDYSRY